MREQLAATLRERIGISQLAVVPHRHAPEGYKVVCKGADAVERWKQLRALASETGYWPVILGNDKKAGRILGVANSEHGAPMNKILDRVATESAEGWLNERREEKLKELQDGWSDRWREVQTKIYGEWPDHVDALKSFTIPLERAGLGPPKPEVTIGLFPVKHCWEVPAYLNFGGWNECPDAVAQVLMMKRWHEKYGAEVVGMNGDVVEMFAARPPSTREEALALAEEQYLFCEDIVLQGTETIQNLAAGLLGNNLWYFWWD